MKATPIQLARMMAIRNFRHRADVAEAEGARTLANLHRETADRIEAGRQDNNTEVQHYLARITELKAQLAGLTREQEQSA